MHKVMQCILMRKVNIIINWNKFKWRLSYIMNCLVYIIMYISQLHTNRVLGGVTTIADEQATDDQWQTV